MIYLDDERCGHLLDQLNFASSNGAKIIVRDGTAIDKEYLINGRYSDALNSNYYALYRTREKYIKLFEKHQFKLVNDEDMFEDNSILNKWINTKLRVYKFIKK